MYQQQIPQSRVPQAPMPTPRNDAMKAAAIILFAIGFCLNILALIPFLGIAFGLLGAGCDIMGFVCLCLI